MVCADVDTPLPAQGFMRHQFLPLIDNVCRNCNYVIKRFFFWILLQSPKCSSHLEISFPLQKIEMAVSEMKLQNNITVGIIKYESNDTQLHTIQSNRHKNRRK